jgi:hypothetical protein
MAPKFALHRITLSADEEYYFLSRPETYTGDIGTQTGITKATDTEQDRPEVDVDKLVRNGKLFRVTVSYKAGTKYRTAKLLCAKTKLGTVLDGLKGKTYTGNNGSSGQITSVRIAQKATFSF